MTLKCTLCAEEFDDEILVSELMKHYRKVHKIKNLSDILETALALRLVGVP